MHSSIYQYVSSLSRKKIAFVDVDFTLSSHKGDTDIPQLLNHRLTNRARRILEEKGYLVVISTSRSEEMLMSSHAYAQSQKRYNFSRPPPHLKTDKKKKIYIPPEKYEPKGILDPPIIISSTGTNIFIKQQDGGYKKDEFYVSGLPDPPSWKKQMIKILNNINKHHTVFTYAPIEFKSSFAKGLTNVFPLDYRIQLYFQNIQKLNAFRSLFFSLGMKNAYLINESNIKKHSYTLFICAKNGKGEAADHVLSSLNMHIHEILVVGDSLPDLLAALHIQSPLITLFLVGGSRISSLISDSRITQYAGDDFTSIKKRIRKILPGIYRLQNNAQNYTIILADEKYPNLMGPKSIIEYLS